MDEPLKRWRARWRRRTGGGDFGTSPFGGDARGATAAGNLESAPKEFSPARGDLVNLSSGWLWQLSELRVHGGDAGQGAAP